MVIGINFIKEKHEVTVNPRCNRIYIRKSFERELRYAIEIKINPENPKELIIEEKPGKIRRIGFSSKKLIRTIAEAIGTNEKMRFYFIKEENNNRWRGVLLPEFQKSYLWDNMKVYHPCTDTDNQNIVRLLKYFYRKYVEADEILHFFNIAKCMAESSHDTKNIESYIWIYAAALLEQLKRAERKKIVVFSYDRKIRTGRACNTDAVEKLSFLDKMGQEDVRYKNLEIEEFLKLLTKKEVYVLRSLMKRADSGEQTGCECSFVKKNWREVSSLRKKANAYYGTSTIKSYFQQQNVNNLG